MPRRAPLAQGVPFLGWQRRTAAQWRALVGDADGDNDDGGGAAFVDDGIDEGAGTRCVASAHDALAACRALAADAPVDAFVCGSLYVVGAVLRAAGADADAL